MMSGQSSLFVYSKKYGIILCIIILVIGVLFGVLRKYNQQHMIVVQSESRFNTITEMMAHMTTESNLVGSGLVFGSSGQGINQYEAYFGNYNQDTQVAIASSTKWVSAVLITILAEKGYFGFDDLVSTYIPSFTDGDKQSITIRMLLSMTAGFEDNADPRKPVNACINDRNTTLEQCVQSISAMSLISKPGEEFNYSPYGYYILAFIAQQVTDMSWEELHQTYIFEPLGMTDTLYARPKSYIYKAGFQVDQNPNPSSGLVTTLRDYQRFMSMLVQCGQVQSQQLVSCDTIQQLMSDQYPRAQIGYTPPETQSHWRYAQGSWIIDSGEGKNSNASIGGFGFYPWIDMQSGHYGIIMVENILSRVIDQEEAIRLEVQKVIK